MSCAHIARGFGHRFVSIHLSLHLVSFKDTNRTSMGAGKEIK